MRTLDEEFVRYLSHLERNRRVTKATLANYRSTLRRFKAWSEEKGVSFGESSVVDFLQTIDHPPSANVMGVRLAGLATFLRKPISICRAKEAHREPEALTASEINRLVMACDDNLATVVTLLSETGLRFAEFCALSEASLRNRSDEVFWLNLVGKGRKERIVPLSVKALDAFRRVKLGWTQYEGDQMRVALAAAGVKAGMPYHVHPHLLRGSMISIALNERGIEAIKVAKIVGHSSVDTMIKHYYRASIESLLEAVA